MTAQHPGRKSNSGYKLAHVVLESSGTLVWNVNEDDKQRESPRRGSRPASSVNLSRGKVKLSPEDTVQKECVSLVSLIANQAACMHLTVLAY